MLKKYAAIGFILLCICTSSGNCTTRYNEDNYWSKHGRYGRSHRDDDDHHKHHKHKHDKDKDRKHKNKHHRDKQKDKHGQDKHGHGKHH